MKKSILRKLLEKRKYEKLYELKPFDKDLEVKVVETKPRKKAKKGEK